MRISDWSSDVCSSDLTSGNAFYATLAHEAVHSTGHRTRLDRETLHKYHDQVAIRAKEEMIAEIGAAYLCAALGMESTEREDHAASVAYWLAALNNDKRDISHASTAGQAASDDFTAQNQLPAPDGHRRAGTAATLFPQCSQKENRTGRGQ